MSELTRREWIEAGELVTETTMVHRAKWRWWIAFLAALALLGVLAACVAWLLYEGVGVWGNNIPVTWALDIVGYDWWIGVGTGSLAISALLLLTGTSSRGAINRLAETVALLSVCAAGLYPIIHLGRPWFFYWNLPYPNTFSLWPQVRSPLFWDAVDIVAFLGVSFLFWFTGLIPDLAAMRDRAIGNIITRGPGRGALGRALKARLYAIPALGWRGSTLHWMRWKHCYQMLAVFGLVLVVSLQTGAAVMFAGSVEPGWHDPMLPLAYLAGALMSGAAVVAILIAVTRFVLPLDKLITDRHLDLIARILLGLAVVNLYCDAASAFTTLLSGNAFELGVLARRFDGPHAWAAWSLIGGALVVPHLFWIPVLRRSAWALGVVGASVAFGLYADHFMLIVVTLQHDFLPSAASPYAMNAIGILTFVGTGGLFLFLFLLVLRYVPAISLVGLREGLSDG